MATKLESIWPDISNGDDDDNELHKAYLGSLEHLASVALERAPQSFATTGLEDTLGFINMIDDLFKPNGRFHGKKMKDLTRQEIFSGLAQDPRRREWQGIHDEQIVNSLCLALSLRLSLDIRPSKDKAGDFLEWSQDVTISTVLDTAFQRQNTPQQAPPAQKLPSASVDTRLTIEYLHKYHGCKVLWVDNLAEHLKIDWIGPHNSQLLVKIYRHKIFLSNELEYFENSPLKKDLIEEALDTLNLLLPYRDPLTAEFLKRYDMLENFYGLGWCKRPRQPDLDHFQYFRESLLQLSEMAKKPIKGYRQLMLDRDWRNIIDFLNFWIAFFVAIFTVISIVFGVVAIVLGYKQLYLAQIQYDLALAQACAATDAASQLPRFCSNSSGT